MTIAPRVVVLARVGVHGLVLPAVHLAIGLIVAVEIDAADCDTPSTGCFQIAVVTISSRQRTSMTAPTLTESTRIAVLRSSNPGTSETVDCEG